MARRYGFYVLVAKTISYSFASLTREILALPLEHKNPLLYECWDLQIQTLRIKIVRPFLRSNPIGHRFYIRKYRMTNHKPGTIFFTSEENSIGFYRYFISLVAVNSVNTNTALPWRIFWNVKRRIQVTKKTSERTEEAWNTTIVSVKVSHASGRLKTMVADWNRFWRVTKEHFQSTDFI